MELNLIDLKRLLRTWGTTELACSRQDLANRLARVEVVVEEMLEEPEEAGEMNTDWPDALEELRATLSTPKPLPEPLYGCSLCGDDYSWPAADLFWSPVLKNWCCTNCWDEVGDHFPEGGAPVEPETSLATELQQRGLNR